MSLNTPDFINGFQPTSEMKIFIGILGYMEMVRMPSVRHYWSQKSMFHNIFVSSAMARNRFELLLKFWHFTDNELCPEGDREFKIEPFVNKLIEKFQAVYTPGETFCIDETLVPFRGILIMKQYIPLKTHKYGIKIFKLCTANGYTWNMKLYGGKEAAPGSSVPTKIVTFLSEKLINAGRTIIMDNYYTSLELASILLDKKTHMIGTLRANRRVNPKEVTTKKLKVGEVYAKENDRGICILKWKDKRDVLLLTTKHGERQGKLKGELARYKNLLQF
ncbi:hypothetical protein NQ314_008204 [Rhamnusium bicolor]|uniref:PiggyBac transposable element-derived protein domain-containing protein n=1 Tax=Rhamnusium bicolor TaxID=1586634 RepID=A0AAV8YF19_9CUCU|nr:hypothetical protein NQ314_008204 [Rhamnusium bicolor]